MSEDKEYAVDDRGHFCKHCGRAAWLHTIRDGKRRCSASSEINAGDVFIQANIPFTVECEHEWVGEGFGARQEPMRDVWRIGERETQYGHEADGQGCFEIHVLEVVGTETCGQVAIYERRWIDPEGKQISKPGKRYSRLSSLKGLISRRKMTRTWKTGSL